MTRQKVKQEKSYKAFQQTWPGAICIIIGVPALIAAWYFGVVLIFGLFY